jgi:hypothetical protein
MQRNNRKEDPDVWQFRWSEIRLDGKRFYHKKIVGTVEQYPDEDAARRSVVGLVSELNADGRPTNSGVLTVAQLCDHFEQRELSKDNSWRSHSPCGFRNDRTDSGRLVGNTEVRKRASGRSSDLREADFWTVDESTTGLEALLQRNHLLIPKPIRSGLVIGRVARFQAESPKQVGTQRPCESYP